MPKRRVCRICSARQAGMTASQSAGRTGGTTTIRRKLKTSRTIVFESFMKPTPFNTGLALDVEARRPGLDSRQATALRKQANQQFGLGDKKVRAFIDCFNQANRQKDPRSDQIAFNGAGTPNDHVKTPSPPAQAMAAAKASNVCRETPLRHQASHNRLL